MEASERLPALISRGIRGAEAGSAVSTYYDNGFKPFSHFLSCIDLCCLDHISNREVAYSAVRLMQSAPPLLLFLLVLFCVMAYISPHSNFGRRDWIISTSAWVARMSVLKVFFGIGSFEMMSG